MKNKSNDTGISFKTDKMLKKNDLKTSSNINLQKKLIKSAKEADDILSGKIKAKGYNNINEFINDMLK